LTTVYDVGDSVHLVVGLGSAPDSAEVREPDDTVTAFVAGDITDLGDGTYQLDFATTQTGEHEWSITADGEVEQGTFIVRQLLTAAPPDVLQAGALCTLSDVVRRVPGYSAGDDPEIDAILNELILDESTDWLQETGREILPIGAQPQTRVFELDQFVAEERELQVGDATAITAVVFKRQDGTVIQTLDDTAWVALPRIRPSWQPIRSIEFPAGVTTPAMLPRSSRNLLAGGNHVHHDEIAEVTGTFGFPEIPKTVRRAVATLVIVRYLNDVASVGTQFAEAANRGEFNLGGAQRAALDRRDGMRDVRVG
jgi:hypothetical protein